MEQVLTFSLLDIHFHMLKERNTWEKPVVSDTGENTPFSKGPAGCVRVEIKTLYLSVSSKIARYSRLLYEYEIILS